MAVEKNKKITDTTQTNSTETESLSSGVVGMVNNPETVTKAGNWTPEDENELQKALESVKLIENRLGEINIELSNLDLVSTNEQKESLETKNYSTDFLKKRIEDLLKSQEVIRKVNSINIEGKGNKIILTVSIEAEKKTWLKTIKINGTIEAIMGNDKNTIIVDDHEVTGDWADRTMISAVLKPQIDKFSNKLKEYIEQTENYEVENMQIKNGQLEVTFKK